MIRTKIGNDTRSNSVGEI